MSNLKQVIGYVYLIGYKMQTYWYTYSCNRTYKFFLQTLQKYETKQVQLNVAQALWQRGLKIQSSSTLQPNSVRSYCECWLENNIYHLNTWDTTYI